MQSEGRRGTHVIARCYKDKPVVLVIWAESGNCILLSTEENFERLLTGVEAPAPVGFARHDVFIYDDRIRADSGVGDWRTLKPLPALSRQL